MKEKDFSYMQAKKDDLTLPLVKCGWKLSILFKMFGPAFGYQIELYASIEKIIEIVCHAIWVKLGHTSCPRTRLEIFGRFRTIKRYL